MNNPSIDPRPVAVGRDSVEPIKKVGRDSVEPINTVGRDSVEPIKKVGRDSVEPHSCGLVLILLLFTMLGLFNADAAVTNRLPLTRAYLTTGLDAAGQSISNVLTLTDTNGNSITGSSTLPIPITNAHFGRTNFLDVDGRLLAYHAAASNSWALIDFINGTGRPAFTLQFQTNGPGGISNLSTLTFANNAFYAGAASGAAAPDLGASTLPFGKLFFSNGTMTAGYYARLGTNNEWYADAVASGGTVTSVSSATASLTVANGTSTPLLTLGTIAITNGGTGSTSIMQARTNLNALGRDKTWANGNLWFYDDFERPNSGWAQIGSAPSTNPVIGGPPEFKWFAYNTNVFSGDRRTNYYITNGAMRFDYIGTGDTNPNAAYPTVDIGFRPTRIGARMRLVGQPGAGDYPQLLFVSGQDSNTFDNAFHFGFANLFMNLGFWHTNSPYLTNQWGTEFYPSGIATNVDVQVECVLDGDLATFYVGQNAPVTHRDDRFRTFGGRYLTFEYYTSNPTNSEYLIELESVWAGTANTVSTYTNFADFNSVGTLSNLAITVSNGLRSDFSTVSNRTDAHQSALTTLSNSTGIPTLNGTGTNVTATNSIATATALSVGVTNATTADAFNVKSNGVTYAGIRPSGAMFATDSLTFSNAAGSIATFFSPAAFDWKRIDGTHGARLSASTGQFTVSKVSVGTPSSAEDTTTLTKSSVGLFLVRSNFMFQSVTSTAPAAVTNSVIGQVLSGGVAFPELVDGNTNRLAVSGATNASANAANNTLPANPLGFLKAFINGVEVRVPFYLP